MGKVICLYTRKRWTGAKARQVRMGQNAESPFREQTSFRQIGEIAGPIVVRLVETR